MKAGQWFAGWGYMRFWRRDTRLNGVERRAEEQDATGLDDSALFHCRCLTPVFEQVEQPTLLGISPNEWREEIARRSV